MNAGDIVKLMPDAMAFGRRWFTMLGEVVEITSTKALVRDADDHLLWWPRSQVVLDVSMRDERWEAANEDLHARQERARTQQMSLMERSPENGYERPRGLSAMV